MSKTYAGGKKTPSTNSAGKSGCLHAKEWNLNLYLSITLQLLQDSYLIWRLEARTLDEIEHATFVFKGLGYLAQYDPFLFLPFTCKVYDLVFLFS